MGIQGRLASIEVKKEVTWGTAPTGNDSVIPLRSASLKESSTFAAYDDLYHGSTGVVRGRAELARDAGGATSVLVGYTGMLILLEAMFGTNTTGGGGPYTHTMTMAEPGSLPSYTLRVKQGSSTHQYTLTGCRATRSTLRWKARQYTVLDQEWIAQDGTLASGSPGTPTIGSVCLPHHAGNVSWNGVSYTVFESLDWEIDRGLQRLPVIGDLKTAEPEPGGPSVARVTGSARLTAAQYATLFASWKAGTQSSLTVTFTSGAESIAMTLDNAQITDLRGDITSSGPMLIGITFEATHDGIGSDGMRAVVTNANSSYLT